MTDAPRDAILVRGARQNNLKNLDLDIAAQRAHRRHGRVGLGQVLAGVRHAVCRRPAPLRRDLLALRAAVPRPHGQAAGRLDQRDPAGDRHRPDQPGAHLALDRRHDDRAQRSPEAAVRARRAAVTAERCGQPVRRDSRREHLCGPDAARRRRPAIRACSLTFPVPVPANFSAGEVRELLDRQGYTRFLRRQRRSRHGGRGRQGGQPGRRPRQARPGCAQPVRLTGDARGRAGPAARRRRRARPRARVARGGAARRPRPRQRAARSTRSEPPRQLATWRYSSELHCAGLRPLLPRARRRALSRSTRRSARARPAAASAAPSASTTGSSSRTRRGRCAAGRSSRGRRKSYAECQQDLEKFAQAARHSARYAVARAPARGAPLGHRGRRRLDAGRSGTA